MMKHDHAEIWSKATELRVQANNLESYMNETRDDEDSHLEEVLHYVDEMEALLEDIAELVEEE